MGHEKLSQRAVINDEVAEPCDSFSYQQQEKEQKNHGGIIHSFRYISSTVSRICDHQL